MHFKCGQGAKTGPGGHLPGSKVIGKIAEVRGLKPGTESTSPSAFTDLITPADFKEFADRAREVSGGIPIGFKMSGNRIERDVNFALAGGADYIILDGGAGLKRGLLGSKRHCPLWRAHPRMGSQLPFDRSVPDGVTPYACR
jgi:glutamate synthase domain-containing protein 2